MPNSYLHDKAGIEQCGDPINAAPLASRCVRARGHLGFHNNGNGAAWGQPRCDFRFTSALRCTLPDAHAGSHHTDAVKQAPRTGQQLAEELFKSASNRWSSLDRWASLSAEQPAEPGVWRPGRQQPRNFYEGDRYVGVAFDPVDTRRVIDAMNAPAAGSELREVQKKLDDQISISRQLRQLRDNVMRDLRRSEELIEQMDDTERETKQRTDHKISVLSQRLDDTIAKADTIAVQQAERFRQLGKALDVDISGQTWDDLIRRVAQLKSELNREDGYRERAESAELALVQAECDAVDSTQPDCPMKCLRVAGHRGTHVDGAGGAW